MTARPPDDQDLPAGLAEIRNTIAGELHAQLALRGESLVLADLPEVAYALTVRLRRVCRIEWAPPWAEDPDDDEPLGLDAAVFHASGLPAGDGPEPAERYPIFDHGWPRRSAG